MKNLKLRRLLLLSQIEKKARLETFDDDVTVVFGENDTGKSCFIKSIYASFGADAAVVNEKWDAAAITLMQFSVNEADFSILRMQNQFALFDAGDDLLWTGSTVLNQIGPQIAELLDFSIELSGRGGELTIPPPQLCLLPFYQDQDRGWNDTWMSFKGVSAFQGFKNSILEYHTGIKPREYYLARAQRKDAQREQKVLKGERRALDRAWDRLRKQREAVMVTFNPELFAAQIEQLLKELNELQVICDVVKANVSGLQSRRAVLVEEIDVAQAALTELDADVKFSQQLTDALVVCPTCQTVHENDFASRFSLMNDADSCRGFLLSARHGLKEVEADIARQLQSLNAYDDRMRRINALLDKKRGDIKLKDMLKDESERIVEETLSLERALIDKDIADWMIREVEAINLMNDHSSASRKAEIIAFYAEKLRLFEHELGVKFGVSVAKSIAPKINETGSYGTRAILAYHFALLHTIKKFTTSCLCPIVIDTPLQQDQDKQNAVSILSFILKHRPRDMQLILGTVSMHEVKYRGHTINPLVKESLLRPELFDRVNEIIRPFINKMLGYEQGELL